MQIDRLALASMLSTRSETRRRILSIADDRHHATPFEPGLDVELALGFAKYLERRDAYYRTAYLLAGALVGFGFIGGRDGEILLVGGLLLGAITRWIKVHGEERSLSSLLQRRTFDPSRIREKAWVAPTSREAARLAQADQNVALYSGFQPFEFAGIEFSSWSVAIDLERGREDVGVRLEPKTVDICTLYDELTEAAGRSFKGAVTHADIAVASGVLPPAEVLTGRLSKPKMRISSEEMLELIGDRDESLRHYRWIQLEQHGGEISQSWFLRCTRNERNLFVEVTQRTQGPVAIKHRRVDLLGPMTWQKFVGDLQASVILGPLVAAWEVAALPFRLIAAFRRALGSEAAAVRKHIEANPLYDYATQKSVRNELSGSKYNHYFQKVDSDLGQKAVDREIFNALVDYLTELDIDTSELREGQSMVLNNGIIVQRGDVSAESLAVGERATATKKTLTGEAVRVGRKAASRAGF